MKPFIRWAGSKRLIAHRLLEVLPSRYGTYIEPFLGGGSLLLRLAPRRAIVGDALIPLADAWQAVQGQVEELIDRVNQWQFDKATYDTVKRESHDDPLARAAQFMYLNRGAYGGLWRVNLDGTFNVPWSAPKTHSPLDEENLRAVARYLSTSDVQIRCADFAEMTANAASGDLVFLDPPYSKSWPQRPFFQYNELLFNWEEQVRLANEAERLRVAGVSVIVTNSTHPDVAALYPKFEHIDVERHDSLGPTTKLRRQISERIFVGR